MHLWNLYETRVAHIFSFLCVVYCVVCLRSVVFCLPNVDCVSGLLILNCPLCFSLTITALNNMIIVGGITIQMSVLISKKPADRVDR